LRAVLLVTVRGESMAPALHEGDRVLAVKFWPLRRGAIVAVRVPPAPGEEPWLWVKRAVALGGQTARVPRAHLHPDADPAFSGGRVDGDDIVWDVPPGHVFVRGDAAHSADSATWGPIPRSAIAGVVVRRLGSPKPAA
jgi:signal peptidase I